jgi:CBS domain-containing protein
VGTVMTEPDEAMHRDAVVAGEATAAGMKVVSIRSTDSLHDALERMLDEHIEQVPVIDDGEVVGVCTRGDIMRARREQFVHERTEPGWLSRKRPHARD